MLNHVSFSGLSRYNLCPYSWYLRYMQSEVKAAMRLCSNLGSEFHKWAELYVGHLWQTGQPSDYQQARTLLGQWSDEWAEPMTSLVELFMESWRNPIPSGDPEEEFLVEHEGRVSLGDDLPAFVFKPDVVHYQPLSDEWTITDFKTGWFKSFPEQPPQQLRWYAWALKESMPDADIEEVTVTRWVVPTGEAQTWIVSAYGEMISAGHEIEELTRRALSDGHWRPTPSVAACQYCDYWHACPAAQRQEFAAPTTDDECAEIIGRMECLSSAASQMRKRAQAWVKEHGSVEQGGKEYGYMEPAWARKGEQRHEPANVTKFVEACQAHGWDWADYLGASGWNGKRLASEIGGIVFSDEAQPFGEEEMRPPKEVAAIKAIQKTLTPVEPGIAWGKRAVEDESEEE